MSEKAVCKKQKRTEESNDEKAIDSEKAVCKKHKHTEESNDGKAIDYYEATVDAEMKKHEDKSFEDLCKWMWTTEPQCVVEIMKQGLRGMEKRENKD